MPQFINLIKENEEFKTIMPQNDTWRIENSGYLTIIDMTKVEPTALTHKT